MATETPQSENGDQRPMAQPRPDTSTMTDKQLANAVLARTIRPRTSEVRRLAEAVVASAGKKQGKKAKDGKPRKLAKIPGQAKKKKKKD